MTDHARMRCGCLIVWAAFAAFAATSCARAAPESPVFGTFHATSVTLRAMGADRISSAARAPNGDVILGVAASSGGGSVVRISKSARVAAFRTADPVASVGVSGDGRICSVPYVRPVVTCRRDHASEHTYMIPGSQPAPKLLRSGTTLFAVDVTNGRAFTVGPTSVRLVAQFTPGAAVAAGSHGLIAVTKTARCNVRVGAELTECVTLRPAFGGHSALVATGDVVFASDYPAAAATIIASTGTTVTRELPFAPYNISLRNSASVWIGMANSAGNLILYALSERELRRYELPSKLRKYLFGDALLLPPAVGDDLVVVDNHQRLVTFLTLRAGTSSDM